MRKHVDKLQRYKSSIIVCERATQGFIAFHFSYVNKQKRLLMDGGDSLKNQVQRIAHYDLQLQALRSAAEDFDIVLD